MSNQRKYLRLTVLPALEQCWARSSFSRDGGGRVAQVRAEHQREPVTAVHLAYAWSFWIKFTYSVISLCPVSSADKNVAPAKVYGGRYARFCQTSQESGD